MKVFITDGGERPALAATRTLGRRNISIIVGSERPRSLAAASKYCSREVTYPPPDRQSEQFSSFLIDLVRREQIDVVLPITDVTTHLVAKHAAALTAHSAVAVPPFEAFELATDKSRLMQRAQACGVPVPSTHVVRRGAELAQVLDRVVYPVVIKPVRSRIPTGDRWLAASVCYARDKDELRKVYQDNPALAGYPTLIQERIVGPGMGLFVLCDHGHVVASFAHRRHREKPPSGGASVLSESVAVDQTLLEHARRLLGPLGWHGVAMLEYKRDHRSGREFLLEINGRFWGSLQLAIDAGVDFPYLACLLALGTLTDGDRPYRLGVKNRWFLGDLDHLLARLLHSGRDLPEGSGSRWRAMLTFLHGFDADTRNEIACGDDLRPALRELTDYVRTLGTSAMERLRVPPRNRGADIAMSQAPIVAKSADASK